MNGTLVTALIAQVCIQPKIYTEAGNYTVTLTVIDNEGEKDTTWKLIKVIPQPNGAAIDLYNQKGGQGRNEPDGAFTLGETVILTALLTYNQSPVQNKPVGFEVTNPSGEVIVDRTAFTNTEGIANITFRLPWPCENPEETVFGTWTVVAKVLILDLTAEDTLTFQVGWIIEITEVKTVNATGAAKTSFAKGEHVYFNLTVKNIAFTSKTATFTTVISDEQDVPIGHATLYNWVIPPGTTQIFIIDLQTPKWAYIGVAIVYANAYTNLPATSGVPYCPETSITIMIQTP